MWLAIAVYVVAASRHARQKRADIRVERLRIAVVDTTSSKVVTAEKVRQWLATEGIDPIGRTVDSADTRTIERTLGARPEVKHVSAWTDLGGTLSVRIEPRRPAMRVRTVNGYRFWYTEDGVMIPDRGDFAALVPVVTGEIPFPFAPSVEGSYTQLREAVWRDYLERFTALDAERRTLSAQRSALSSEIRSTRLSSPRRWWSERRKTTFTEGKAVRIADLVKQRDEVTRALSALDKLEHSLREKEKKSQQSHLFLSKLANFVEFIGRDHFWASQVVQINVLGGGGGSASTDSDAGSERWREPQLELVPRAGDQIILLGELDGTERSRLENLRLFYREAMWHEGWNEYGYINIKYENQIVCTK